MMLRVFRFPHRSSKTLRPYGRTSRFNADSKAGLLADSHAKATSSTSSTTSRHAARLHTASGWVAVLALLLGLGLSACQEVAPPVVGAAVIIDTTFVDPNLPPVQARVALLEDFTGVRCVNCPDAHALAKSIFEAHPGQVALVSEHNYFEGAYPNSDEDFRNEESFAINDLLGPTSFWPIGLVNRNLFPGEPALLLTMAKWTGYVEDAIAEPPVVNVTVETSLDATARVVEVIVELHFLEDVDTDLRLSVMLLENGILDPQLTSTGVQDDYLHEHVLRRMPTPATGAIITTSTEQGRVIRRGYEIPLEDWWVAEELEVIAFVHEGTAADKAVLQAQLLKVE
jgi:hypothetical protein